jgi:Transposase, Mutator family
VTDTNVFQLCQPGAFADPLTEVLRNGARTLLAHAVEAEVAGFLSGHSDKLTGDGHQRLVRHGYLPERKIMTGIGPVVVRCPRVRDRIGEGCRRIRFSLAILPPYAHRSNSLEVLIPVLYLKGVSTGDFEEALVAATVTDDEHSATASAPSPTRTDYPDAGGSVTAPTAKGKSRANETPPALGKTIRRLECAPKAGQDQAAVLTVCRACRPRWAGLFTGSMPARFMESVV